MNAEVGKRCEFCVIVMGQPYCEDLNRQLPTVQGYEPFRPADCKVKELTNRSCTIVRKAEKVSSDPE